MPKIKINGRELEVAEGITILEAALSNGIYIPHFCYHPHLAVSGNCRMCLVDVKPGPPKLSISCATTVAEGMMIETENEKVRAARAAVMEFILKNHPVDCPICDQAGECVLHEYYMKYDLKPSRLFSPEDKVKKQKRRRLGKNLVLDSERCILCTRCLRFVRNVSRDESLAMIKRSDKMEITTFPGKTVDNPYSLCLTDVCPVGAWTSADFRFKQRVWFLQPSASICPHCSRGCNIWIDHRREEAFRIRPRVNIQVNESWACDEGRLNYHLINDNRLTMPLVNKGGGQKEVSWQEALKAAGQIMAEAGEGLSVIVSASFSLEEGKALLSLQESLGAKVMLNKGKPGWEDNILRRSDMNANTKGLMDLGITETLETGIDESAVLLVFETLGSAPLPEGTPSPAIVISPSVTPAAKAAKVALPAASYAETAGTVVNFMGVSQSYSPALKPKGQALSHTEIIGKLTGAAQKAGE
ncbi:MAG TPA: 2Fe-2S iron-sulfur cluster-binding protein [Desulfatiglandales bacterium]|nr:2Fe-2S iron-sulfur cluster-binding protein [Desulfatiglandales bacterium]